MSNNGLKTHKDIKYSENLTSNQIWKVLNNLLFEVTAPLSVYGNFAIETAITCLVLSTNNRRRISSENPSKFLNQIFYEIYNVSLHKDDEQNKIDLLNFMYNKGIERNIITDHIYISLNYNNFPIYLDKNKLHKNTKFYLNKYDAFKKDVVFRYYYMTKRESERNSYVKNLNGLKTTKEDMFHVYVISAMRALDKFVPYKGALTSYIQTWFKNAEGSSDFVVYDNEAFSLNRNIRNQIHTGDTEINNCAIPLEDRENFIIDDNLEILNSNKYVHEFLKECAILPNSPIVFMVQGFPYKLSNEQKNKINGK